ncbi:uncharacterized protein LOC125881487 [Epinephelus fuscoguttatus]|uniref:uncharacterized protein LOC125881487 n=1 Tax=Epinephelus fuscoguttatus TaxID=293821 RepID=UPI0020D085A0|nr:uncharacterized protein LOC125881487 [Epinephelus fuscoguttatus]
MSKNQLSKNEHLRKGEYLMSNNGEWKAILKEDGNFVICGWKTVWESDTAGSDVVRLSMQADSNLVMYNQDDTPRWHTNTYFVGQGRFGSKCECNCHVQLTDDGQLVLLRESKEVWSSANSKGTK